ncbi:MAG: hypothetical protein PHV30_10665, partial [Candidatus Margulisbacteria bacterium]|nr:hypothetical protein [Candidatus Margulisiibacteriota bacterium]
KKLQDDLLGEKNRLEKEASFYADWGMLEPGDITFLRSNKIHANLYKIPLNIFNKIKKPEHCIIIKKTAGLVYVLALSYPESSALPFDKAMVPDMSYHEIKTKIAELNVNFDLIQQFLEKNSNLLPDLKNTKKLLLDKLEFFLVCEGLHKEEGHFSYLQGYCPEKYLQKVKNLCASTDSGYLIEEPAENDEVPTFITNPPWTRIISPVFNFMNTIPGYKEFDISFVFLIFFSLFFAMLIGDAGYASIFLVITYILRRKFRTAPYEPFFLMYILSAATLIWGAITGTWFGFENIAKLPLLNNLVIPSLNSFSETSTPVVMSLCFLIGAIHLTVAHSLKASRMLNSPRILAEAGWIMIIWNMYFLAHNLVLGNPYPSMALKMLFTGMALVLLFNNYQKNMLKGVLDYLANFPLEVIASFGDVVSYLRLFAVGYASVIVSQSFNSMALGNGVNSILSGFIAALILVAGHALNIILGFMAVIVHGVRLNMLEFSGHLGQQWSGIKYEPFKEG